MSGAPESPERSPQPEQAPPFLGSWRRIYVVVVIELLVTIAVFYALARWAA